MTRSFTAIAILAFLAANAQGSVIFTDDFEGVAAGSNPDGTKWTFTTQDGGAYATVKADTGNLFGAGTANQYLEAGTSGGGGGNDLLLSVNGISETLLTFSFDFVAPDSFPADGEIQIDRGNFNNFNQFDRLQLDTDPNDGTGDIVTTSFTESDAYNALEKNRLDIVINVTGSGVSYQSKTVAHDTYDVWLNGNLIIDGAAGQGTGDTKAISGLRFRAAGNGRMFYDNVEVRDEAFVIPEPASLALLGLGGLMTLGRSRRAGRA